MSKSHLPSSVARTASGLAMALTLASAWLPPAHAEEPTLEFTVKKSDTLEALSANVLTSPLAWREVARINRLSNPNRIWPGQRLRIPERLMRSEAVNATVVGVSGDVRTAGSPAAVGSRLSEGQSIETGEAGSAVIALADGSQVRMPPSSLAEVAASRHYGRPLQTTAPGTPQAETAAPWFAGTLRLLRGSVEVFASKVLRAKPLEVITPTAVVGVRGTHYRVGLEEGDGKLTHSEVLEGQVRFDSATRPTGAEVSKGLGAAIDAVATTAIVEKLLPSPDLSTVPERFERPIVRFLPPPGPPLHFQIAADAGFERIVSDQKVKSGVEVRVTGLDDAQWFLRARSIDPNGIEGYDASRTFVLKARPEPPAYRAPRPASKQSVGVVEFNWAANAESQRARLQVATDEAFKSIVNDTPVESSGSARSTLGEPGVYFWRVATVRADGDQGPFGDPQRFELRPMPEPPAGGRSGDGNSLEFRWNGRAGDRQQVELARDAEFKQLVATAELDAAEWTLPLPTRGGRYYFRYRSVEPDGFVTANSATLVVDIPRDWSGLGLLLPLLLLL
jgi:hypothetical protein